MGRASLAVAQLKNVLAELISQPSARKPEAVKFFRGQMQTIITRALGDLEIKPVPSRRCFTLLSAHATPAPSPPRRRRRRGSRGHLASARLAHTSGVK